MNKTLAMSTIALIAVIMIFGTASSAMAAKDPITICHFDEDPNGDGDTSDGAFVQITIAGKALKAHAKNHPQDTQLADDGTCVDGAPLDAAGNPKKMKICHFNEETQELEIIDIAKKAVKAHKKNHPLDTKLADDGTCVDGPPL